MHRCVLKLKFIQNKRLIFVVKKTEDCAMNNLRPNCSTFVLHKAYGCHWFQKEFLLEESFETAPLCICRTQHGLSKVGKLICDVKKDTHYVIEDRV